MQPIRSDFIERLTGGLSQYRAALAELTPAGPSASSTTSAVEIGIPGPPVPEASSAPRAPESTLGAAVGVPGAARRIRLALDPRVRAKLERLESQASSARAEVFRLGDLIDAERQRQAELDHRYATLEANYLFRADKAEVDAIAAERATCDEEIAALTVQRNAAQERWQRLARLAERCRVHLGLPASGGR
jgi:hypothetical protein